jgi:hypothetical protein
MPFYARLGFEIVVADDLPPALRAIAEDETRRGLDPLRRVVMTRPSGLRKKHISGWVRASGDEIKSDRSPACRSGPTAWNVARCGRLATVRPRCIARPAPSRPGTLGSDRLSESLQDPTCRAPYREPRMRGRHPDGSHQRAQQKNGPESVVQARRRSAALRLAARTLRRR